MNKIKEVASKAKKYVVNEPEEKEQSLQDEIRGLCPSLTYTQRMYGFAICFCVAWFCSFLSVLAYARPTKFAILYTVAALASIGSTMFLMGPISQLKWMFKEHRAIATTIYLLAMAVTLYLAFTEASVLLILLAILVQFLAMVWYCLSYVPFGRRMAAKCMQSCII